MSYKEPGQDAIFLIVITIAVLISIIVFAFIFFVVWPSEAVEDAQKTTVMIDGQEVDKTVAKAYNVQQAFYQQSMAMVNGTYWT